MNTENDYRKKYHSPEPIWRWGTSTTSIALTNQRALVRELRYTEEVLHRWIRVDSQQNFTPSTIQYNTNELHDIKSMLRELIKVSERSKTLGCESTDETEYMNLLQQAILSSLIRVLYTRRDEIDSSRHLGEVQMHLLELAVGSAVHARQVAFTLLLQLAASVNLYQLKGDDTTSSELYDHLFSLLNDMLTKVVVVASTSRNSDNQWVLHAVTCLLLFTKSGSDFCRVRLAKLDASTLVFLLRSVSTSRFHEVEQELVKLVICTMYTQQSTPKRTIEIPVSPRRNQPSSALEPAINITVSHADVERFGGVDLYLTLFYNTLSNSTRRLLFALFFDLTLEHIKKNKSLGPGDAWAPLESLLALLQEWDLGSLLTERPLVFSGTAIASIVRILHSHVENELLEKQVHTFVQALRTTMQIDDYFVASSTLSHAVHMLLQTSDDYHQHGNRGDRLMKKIHGLMSSEKVEERFHGVRWLAEALTYKMSTQEENSTTMSSDEHSSLLGTMQDPLGMRYALEKMVGFDQHGQLWMAARTMFWQLGMSTEITSRLLFARVLTVFTKRRLSTMTAKHEHILEINLCLELLVSRGEDNVGVLTIMVDLLMHLAVREVSYMDTQRQVYDRACVDGDTEDTTLLNALAGSDSLAARVLRGDVALDKKIIASYPPSFLMHALAVFDGGLHPSAECRDGCCGVVQSVEGDLFAVTALMVVYMGESPDLFNKLGGITAFTSYLDSCDSRVAIFVAKFLNTQLKQLNDTDQYYEVLRELHAIAVDEEDETLLANEYAHTRALLHRLQIP